MDDSRKRVLGERGGDCRGHSGGNDEGSLVITGGEVFAELHARV